MSTSDENADRWSYETAFARNQGLVTPDEQALLRGKRVAIIGLGGVGGIHLVTLARLGVGRFTIADPDHFDVVNFNRQYGATVRSVGQSKAQTMANEALAINPSLDLQVLDTPVSPDNVDAFLDGADLLVDGVDFYNIEARRLAFREACRRNIWALTAGPIGLSTAWLTFDPYGMSFDRYFDLDDQMSRNEQLIAFAVGLTPRATQLPYMSLDHVDFDAQVGPSLGLACQLCAGVATAEALKILLGRGPVRPAPCYFQFDAYRQILRKGRLRGGNRHPIQRIKRRWLTARLGR